MTLAKLRHLLEDVPDTREIVLREPHRDGELRHRDELAVVWSAARAEANLAYDTWCAASCESAYVAYRAAEDRANAAEDALSAVCAEGWAA